LPFPSDAIFSAKVLLTGGGPGDDHYRPAKNYGDALAGVLPVAPENREAVVEAMWSVVNEAGTAGRIRKSGHDIAGKSGTAQVVGLGKDVGRNKDHSWFVSYAPAFKPELAVLALIENSGFGSQYAAPAARALYDVYFESTPHREQVAAQIAQSER
jgi:penicillin-binding protein 2